MKKIILILIVFMSLQTYSQTYNLTVSVTNFHKIKGIIVVSVFNSAEDFPKDGMAYKTITSKVDAKKETIIFKNLPKGYYAIALYHDENSDGKCNRNIFGMPKEAYGFSKNIKPKLSAPSFDDCKIYLNKKIEISIELIF